MASPKPQMIKSAKKRAKAKENAAKNNVVKNNVVMIQYQGKVLISRLPGSTGSRTNRERESA